MRVIALCLALLALLAALPAHAADTVPASNYSLPMLEPDRQLGPLSQTVAAAYQAFMQGDLDGVLDHLGDDIAWNAEGPADGQPLYGLKIGKDEVRQWFMDQSGLGTIELSNMEFIEQDDAPGAGTVVVLGFQHAHYASGGEFSGMFIHFFRIIDGKIRIWHGFEDTASQLRALNGQSIR
jgi:ketosteroid isomerase-like protein